MRNFSRRLLLSAAVAAIAASPCAQVTRIEQTDPHITYTGTWYNNTATGNSGGTATLAIDTLSAAAITFTGTGIAWIGVRDPGAGRAWVNLDGVGTVVDTYAAATQYQQTLFSAQGLPDGPHTLFVNVSGQASLLATQPASQWVWIDAFDITNGGPAPSSTTAAGSLIDLSFSSVVQSPPPMFGPTNGFSNIAGTKWTVTFSGTAVVWFGGQNNNYGIANVYVDGTKVGTVDAYSAVGLNVQPLFGSGLLAAGTHTMTVEVTGTHDSSSKDNFIDVGGFQIIGVPQFSGPPVVNNGGVVNGASFVPAPNNQVAAGQIISIFGSQFLLSGQVSAGTVPLPTQMGANNTTVTACGQNLPLFYVSPRQINAQLPWECPQAGTTPLTVTVNGQTSAPQPINLVAAAPGTFRVSVVNPYEDNVFLAAILHGNNTIVGNPNSASTGEEVAIYCTGLGPTSPSFATGTAATSFNQTVNPVTVTIDGNNAPVVYAGLTQGFVGLYQVNVIVPKSHVLFPLVVITANGISSTGAATMVSPSTSSPQ